jgi:glycosyltransferase involved in cell wall biosynthesis
LRILQLIDHFGAGGAQEIVIELLHGLSARADFDIEIARLFPGDACANRIRATGVKVHSLQTKLPYRPWAVPDPRITWRLASLLKRGDFDAVHVHLYAAPLHLYAACALVKRRPRIYNTVHAQRAHLPSYVFPALKLLRGNTDFFVAEATTSIDDLRGIGIPLTHLAYVPIGIKPISAPNPADVLRWRTAHCIPTDALVVTSIARLHAQRQVDRIISGFANYVASEAAPNAILVIVGDGEERGKLETLTRGLGIWERVRFTGHCDNLPVLLGATSIYAGIEIQGDLSIAPLQALSMGVPCVALDFDSRRRVTERDLSEVNLCLVEPDERGFGAAIARLFGSSQLARQLVEHGQGVVLSRRTIASMIDGYAQLYKGGHPGEIIVRGIDLAPKLTNNSLS